MVEKLCTFGCNNDLRQASARRWMKTVKITICMTERPDTNKLGRLDFVPMPNLSHAAVQFPICQEYGSNQ